MHIEIPIYKFVILNGKTTSILFSWKKVIYFPHY